MREKRESARARVPDLIPYALLSACIYFLFSKLFLFEFAHSLDEVAASACFVHTHWAWVAAFIFQNIGRMLKSFHYDVDLLIRLTKARGKSKTQGRTHTRAHTHTNTQTSSHIRMRIYLCAVVHPMTPLIARSTYVVGGWRWLCFGLDHLFSPRSRKDTYLERIYCAAGKLRKK
jgi:hypothetical protein